ncbi:MAG: glutamate racemase [Clostridiales bacterium]|nr:glutamate racemase [Candidatus Crickella caballi]
MDNRPIGFFDSGLGGLTSVQELHEKLPNEKVLYFGDTARTPYGSKSPETIRNFATQIVDYLVSKDCKMIIIACNTVTAMALESLRERYPDIPILGVIEPTVRRVTADGCNSIGVIATKATIGSDVYGEKLREQNPDVSVKSLACPALVPLIEEGFVEGDIIELAIKHYMDDFINNGDFDSLILGCTHYPLLTKLFEKLYPGIRLYSSSAEVVNEAAEILKEKDMLADSNDYQDRYYASDLSDNFIAMTEYLFKNRDSRIKLKKLED